MVYKKTDMIKQSLEAIQENDLIYIEEIITFVPFSKKTFYNQKLHELPDIKKALEDNRIRMKIKLRKNWADSKSPALQIALYRLLADEKEYERLVQQKFDHTTKGDSVRPLNITVAKPEMVERFKQHIEKLKNLN